MTETEAEIIRRLANIESRVQSIEETTAFTMRLNRDDHREQLREIFGTSKRRAQVYLCANGERTVNDIAATLAMKKQNVSIDLHKLERAGLLRVSAVGSASYWSKKPLDWSLGASELLMQQFNLDKNGKENS